MDNKDQHLKQPKPTGLSDEESTLWTLYSNKRSNTYHRKDHFGDQIYFKLTFEEWLSLWNQIDPKTGKPYHLNRGSQKGQYVLCRCNDRGNYELGNVYIGTTEHNAETRSRVLNELKVALMESMGDSDSSINDLEKNMGLTKQAKVLSKKQLNITLDYLRSRRNPVRNQVIFLLSVKAGLRAKEISGLQWIHVVDSNGVVDNQISLPNIVSKGNSGRVIPLNKQLKKLLENLLKQESTKRGFNLTEDNVITSIRSGKGVSPNVMVQFFHRLYQDLGFTGCSSHSGRRTFITNTARLISSVDGSLNDVKELAGHSSLAITQRYIDTNEKAKSKIVDLI